MAKKERFYIQFHENLPVAEIPASRLSSTGTWARKSGHIYEGTTELSSSELAAFLSGECGLPRSSFQVIPFKDGVLFSR